MTETLTPSASSADAAAPANATDAKSSATSSSAENGAKPAPSLKDHLFGKEASSVKSKLAAEEGSPASVNRETDKANPTTQPAKAGEEGAADPEAKEEKPLSAEEEAKLPFHTHPRWRQMKNENAGFRQELDEAKPKAAAYDDFVGKVTDAKLSGQDLDELLNVGKTLKHDPKAAYEYLVKYTQDLGTTLGIIIPPELKKRVEDGYLTEEDAAELARAKANSTMTEAQLRQKEKDDATAAATADKAAKKTALSKWEFDWKGKDPDYDMLQPEVQDRFLVLARVNPPKTDADIVKLADEALKEIRTRRKLPIPAAIKPPVQSGASVQTLAEPKNMRESMIQRGRGSAK
jgi:hypothetical protein